MRSHFYNAYVEYDELWGCERIVETPLFFRNGDYRLFGVLHEPDPAQLGGSSRLSKLSALSKLSKLSKLNEPSQLIEPTQLNELSDLRGLGLVFCHPFAEEKLIAHRSMVNLARTLTAHGVTCLRFDETGHGDSGGNFEDSTVETRLSDIGCALQQLRHISGITRVGLIGLRFGGTLAAKICSRNSGVDFLIMISPVIDGKTYFDQCLRSNLTTQMTTYGKIIKDRPQLIGELLTGQMVNIDGYMMRSKLYQEMSDIDLLNDELPAAQSILLLQVSAKENQSAEKDLDALYQRYKTSNAMTGFQTIREDTFWKDGKMYAPHKENLEAVILKWLSDAYSGVMTQLL